ncbi:MAG: hypothetical protein O2794_01980 [bacterium]|nr:hypothetical protein [bacterium]
MQLLPNENLRAWIDMYARSAIAPPHVFGLERGDVREQTGNGLRKCALFVSSVLIPIVLEPRPRGKDVRACQTLHLTVDGLERDLCNWSGWVEKNPDMPYTFGDVVIYVRSRSIGPNATRHVGIVYDTQNYPTSQLVTVASTNPEKRGMVELHRIDELPYTTEYRAVERTLRHPFIAGVSLDTELGQTKNMVA